MGVWQDAFRFVSAFVKAGSKLRHPRIFLWCLVAIIGSLASAPEAAEARTETIRWTHPNPSIVDGFRIFGRYEGQGYATPWFDGFPVPSGGVYEVEFDVDDGATLYFVATAFNQTQESVLSNEITRLPPICGDGSLDPGEMCDDGNNNDGDGCDASCVIEIPPACGDGSIDPGEQCDDGNINNGDGCDAACRIELPPICGDGALDPGEQCDDGNANNGDGCNANCRIEILPICGDGNIDPGEQCDDSNANNGDGCDAACRIEIPPTCGDRNVDPGEQCDDGNTNNGDGCDAACRIELPPTCGDGNVDPGEQCDDGNANNGDGCDATCRIEIQPMCGDGRVDPGEQCDDGNTNSGDGCNATCRIEIQPMCGDGRVDPGEQCDDGNTNNGDGCSVTCRVEVSPMCGNRRVDPGEQCDDGNTNNGDGCDDSCAIERLEPPTLLLNPDFDNSVRLGGWTPFDGTIDWTALDVDGLSESGSARIRSTSSHAGGILSECVPVTSGAEYDFGGWGYRSRGSRAGNFMTSVYWFRDSGCQSQVGIDTISTVLTEERWSEAEGRASAPASANSALIEVAGSDPLLVASIDAVSLVPEPGHSEGAFAALVVLALTARARRHRQV